MTPAKVKTRESTNHQLERLKSRMEKTRRSFLADMENFVREWFIERVDHYIDLFPEIEKQKTAEELRAIKKDAKLLAEKTASRIVRLFDEEENWWHIKQNSTDRDRYKEIDNILTEEGRIELGKVGLLLHDYGFLPLMVKPFFGFISGKKGDNTLYFKYLNPINWSRNSKRLMDNYWEDYKWCLKIISEPVQRPDSYLGKSLKKF